MMEDIISGATSRYDYIRFTVVDLIGVCRTKVLPRHEFVKALKSGTEVNAGLLRRGYDGSLYSETDKKLFTCHDNELLVPELETLHSVPLASTDTYKVGQVFCDVRPIKGSTEEPHLMAPREVAKKQLERLHQLGIELYSGYEIEVTIEDKETSTPDDRWNMPCNYSLRAWLSGEAVILESDKIASEMGVKNIGMHFESRLGNMEIIGAPLHGLEGADNVVIMREVLHEVAHKYGKRASFLSFPFPEAPMTSSQINHSLRRLSDDVPILYDVNEETELSTVARHWLAGLIKHQAALSALFLPTQNCFRGASGDPIMPRYANWSVDDRYAGVRVKQSSAERCYFEMRNSGAPCSAYVLMAGTIAAGLDGLLNELECPTESHSQAKKLPTNSEEALILLEKDTVLKEAFGDEYIRLFCMMKRDENKNLDPKADLRQAIINERRLYLHSA